MELRHLRYFVAVAEALNYRRAAERLHVAQPALSKQIKDLEEEIGARLLDRNTGGVTLTDAGIVLLDEARDVLERVDMACTATRAAAEGKGGRLTIGSSGALTVAVLPAALGAFRQRYPSIEVNLHDTSFAEQMAALKAGTIQVGFVLQNLEAIPAGFEAVEVLSMKVHIALGSDHPLARRNVRVALADLAGEQFLCISTHPGDDLHIRRTQALLHARGIRHRPLKRVSSFESLVALVAGGHGVAMLLPVRSPRGTEQVVFRRIKEDGDDLGVRLAAVWRRSGGSRLAEQFVAVLRDLHPRREPA